MCDLRIHAAPYMSTRHFSMTRDDDGSIYVEDVGSTNGTDVLYRGRWVTARYGPVPIEAGSKILAGRVLFKIDGAGQVSVHKDVGLLDRDKV